MNNMNRRPSLTVLLALGTSGSPPDDRGPKTKGSQWQKHRAALPLREYESIYVLRPDLAKATAEKVLLALNDVIAREGGKLTLVENWGRRQLAYKVQRTSAACTST